MVGIENTMSHNVRKNIADSFLPNVLFLVQTKNEMIVFHMIEFLVLIDCALVSFICFGNSA